MNVIDLLVTIVVVTILVTIVLAIVTYVAYKLRLSREPSDLDRSEDGLRYFVAYPPPGVTFDAAATPTETTAISGHAT
ncbi:MAG: hypothetical protein OEO79_08105 [Gemmatimonadota bacterium]|nr:hypothetical protein [Gemmatimonadota bacterium]